MEEYESNSLKARNGETEKTPEKKIGPVVSGATSMQKKSGFSKFADNIIAESFSNVCALVWTDVIIPSTKNLIYDVIKNGIEMALFGKSSGPRSNSNIQRVSYRDGSYTNYSRSSTDIVRAGSANTRFDFDNIIFSSRGDAEAVLETMEDLIDSGYEQASVADLYELADVPAPSYTANKYGWTSLKGAQVVRCRDGYILNLPRVKEL